MNQRTHQHPGAIDIHRLQGVSWRQESLTAWHKKKSVLYFARTRMYLQVFARVQFDSAWTVSEHSICYRSRCCPTDEYLHIERIRRD